MRQYLDLVREIMEWGVDRSDRTGVGTRALFGLTMRYRMGYAFPAVTTKDLFFHGVVGELLWFLSGSSDVRELEKLGIKIWNGNAYDPRWLPKARFPGDAGRNYGVQWRRWLGPDGREVDQVSDVIKRIKEKPHDRRHLVTAWNPAELEQTCLPACHAFFQFHVAEGKLWVEMYQRSCDMFLGVPFNIAQYALILHLFARFTGLEPYELIHHLGDAHIYRTHFEAVKEQLKREPYPMPTLWLNPELKSLQDVVDKFKEILERAERGEKPSKLTAEVARLENYQHHPAIKAPMAV